jgi:tetratricopeptide (TPR) repeat protein
MSSRTRLSIFLLWAMIFPAILPAVARAANEGQGDLDKATEAKLNANTIGDLDEVIGLAESALKKGLDEGNTQFAKNLLASTLVQRGSIRGEIVFRLPALDSKAAELRKPALDDLERAVQLDPKQAQALLIIAELNRLPGGDLKRSNEALDQAIRLATDDPETKAKARTFRATIEEKPEKKLADLDEAVRLAPGNAAAVRTRGMVRADFGKADEALADLDKASELDPKNAGTYEAKAIVLGRLKKYEEALVALDQARQISPSSIFPLVQKARIHALQSNLKAAMLDLDQAHSLDPGNLNVLLLRATMQEDTQKKAADFDEAVRIAPKSTLAWRSRGLFLVDLGKYEQALADFHKAIQLEPKEVSNYEAKILVLGRLKKYDEALATVDKIRELSPKAGYLLMQKARIHIAQADLKAALADLSEARKQEPDNIAVLLLRATVYQESGEKEKAMADADEALKIEPKSGAAMRLRAMLLADAGKFEEAVVALEKLRELDPADSLALLQLAMLYSSLKKSDKAIEIYTAVLTEDPEQWMALRGRGDALLNLGKQAEAVADYDKAIKLKPKDVGILNNLAWVLATSPDDKLRDGKRAVELATQACEATAYKMPHILSTLAAAYAESGDFKTAIQWSTKALELSTEEQKKNLAKEMESYRAGKPFREVLSEAKPAEKDKEKKDQPLP